MARFSQHPRQQAAVAPYRMRAAKPPGVAVRGMGLRQQQVQKCRAVGRRPPRQQLRGGRQICHQKSAHASDQEMVQLRNGPGPNRSDSCATAIENPGNVPSVDWLAEE